MKTAVALKRPEPYSPPEQAPVSNRAGPILGHPLRLEAVSKRYGARGVLDAIDLDIPAGQFLAIVGRSGGGKTTLLRLLAGLEGTTAGRVNIAGRVVSQLQPSVRLLFQDARLLPWQTVHSNVGIARDPGWRERAYEALADVGLADRANDWPAVLSGGQKQRVALARALVSRPGVLLLDEPFGALDALTRSEMHDLLARIWTEHGFTIVLITHDVSEALALADRVVVLREGRVDLDIPIDVPRPRPHADPKMAKLHAKILGRV